MTKTPAKRKHAFHAMLRAASDAVPPAWPLEASVAVNPFMGMGRGGAAAASARLADVAGTGATMPRRWFADAIAAGTIGDADQGRCTGMRPGRRCRCRSSCHQAVLPRGLSGVRRPIRRDP